MSGRRSWRRIWIGLMCGAATLLAMPSFAQDGSFVSAGLRLHYRSIGAGEPVIILSGGPGFNVEYMLPVADAFPNHRRILLEQRGTGRSRTPTLAPEAMTLSTVVQDLETLREHLEEDRLFLVGHSWGGMLAMAYASEHPANVERLILIDSGGPTLEFTQWFEGNIRARLRPEDLEAERYWRDAANRGVAADKVALESARALTPAYFYDRRKGLEFAAGMAADSLHADAGDMLFADLARSYDLRNGLRAFDRPTLIVQGHQDPIGDKTAEDIHELIEGSTLFYIHECGHFPWIEQPEAFREGIRVFLANHP